MGGEAAIEGAQLRPHPVDVRKPAGLGEHAFGGHVSFKVKVTKQLRRCRSRARHGEILRSTKIKVNQRTCRAATRSCSTAFGPYVCAGCCSQGSLRLDFESRAYVSGLLIGARAVAMLGLRSLHGLISGKAILDQMGRQTLGACLSVPNVSAFANSFERGRVQTAIAASPLSSNRVPWRRTLQAIRASLLASATASLFRCIIADESVGLVLTDPPYIIARATGFTDGGDPHPLS